MKKVLTLAVAAVVAGGSAMTQAYEAGDWILRAGVATVAPDASSDDIALPGVPVLEADVDDGSALSIIPLFMATDKFGIELLAATPFKHDITVAGAGVKLDAGETKQLPPTLSVQWYPRGGKDGWQPYIGLGVNYTTFFSESVDGELEGALQGILGDDGLRADLELDDSFGLAAQAGVDIPFSENWSFNAGVWYIDIDTTATVTAKLSDGGKVPVKFDVDIDPWVYNIGIAYKF